MSTPSLSELLNVPDLAAILEGEVFAALRDQKVKVTDWIAGGPYRTLAFGVANMWREGRVAISTLAAARFGDYVFGFVAPPGGIDVTSYATVFAKQVFGVTRIEATNTKRRLVIANSTASTYGPIPDGRLIIQFTATGNRYVNDGELTIGASGNTTATFRSESAVDTAAGLSYLDSSGATIQLISASYPGVTLTNPAPTFSDVVVVNGGTGTITPSGAPGAAHRVAVRVDSPGVVGGGSWSTSLDGAAWVNQGAIGVLANLGGTGITITPADNGGTPSFPVNALFSFENPGTDRLVVGRDQETPQDLGTRCRALYPLLGFPRTAAGLPIPLSPTLSGYEALARSASDEVKVCFVITDGTINNKVLIYIAGQGAKASAVTIGALQAFFNSLGMLTDYPVVATPAERAITLGGATIKIKAALLLTGQQALQRSLGDYLGGVDPKTPLSVNGLLDRSYLNALLRGAPGVTHVDDGLTINTVAADLQLPVTPGAFELSTWTQNVASAFTWVTV